MRSILFISLIPSLLFSQIDTTGLLFMPMHIDNYWEYEIYYMNWNDLEFETSYECSEIIGDTVFSNNKCYRIVLHKFIPDTLPHSFTYIRLDSGFSSIYKYDPGQGLQSDESILYNLKSQVGDTAIYNPLTICVESYSDTILGLPTCIKCFTDISWSPGSKYCLAQNLGYIRRSVGEKFWWITTTLKYARINKKEYGVPLSIQKDRNTKNDFQLFKIYPNPFNSITRIEYHLIRPSDVKISIYTILGKKITTYQIHHQLAGIQYLEINANSWSSGIYIFEIKEKLYTRRIKATLIK